MYPLNFWMLSASASGSVLSSLTSYLPEFDFEKTKYGNTSLFSGKAKSAEMHCSNSSILPVTRAEHPADISVLVISHQDDFEQCVDWVMANYDPTSEQFILYLGDHEDDNCRLTKPFGQDEYRLNCYSDYGYEFDSCYFGEHFVDCAGPLEEKCVTLLGEWVIGAGEDVVTECCVENVNSIEECNEVWITEVDRWTHTHIYNDLSGNCRMATSFSYELQTEYVYQSAYDPNSEYISCAFVTADTVFPPERPTTTTPCVDTVDHCATLVSYETACSEGFDFDHQSPKPTSSVCPATCAEKYPSKTCIEWLNSRE
eukprot:GHVH01009607.1.p1 GENE.GHVH01009607.1~~GHVH01009607.1.p1  ORF type:complete len:313 (+),score=38.19 GHVH01009607.1:79-1017(+)